MPTRLVKHTERPVVYVSGMATFQTRLAEAFRRSSLKKADIARACGISRASVSDWFTGATKEVTGPNLVALAGALNVNPRWLATGKGPMEVGEHSNPPSDVGELTPEEETLVLAWRALPVGIKKHIHSLCTEYAANRIGLPALANGSYEQAEKANAHLTRAQTHAQVRAFKARK